jgi:hypothetical protein
MCAFNAILLIVLYAKLKIVVPTVQALLCLKIINAYVMLLTKSLREAANALLEK